MAYQLERAIATFRKAADEARAELEAFPAAAHRRYLIARINQCSAEAAAMQRSVDAWEADVARAERAWEPR